MTAQLTSTVLLKLDPELVRIVPQIGVSVFVGKLVHVFPMPNDIERLNAFCWAHHIPFQGNSTVEIHHKAETTKHELSDAQYEANRQRLLANVAAAESRRKANHLSDSIHGGM